MKLKKIFLNTKKDKRGLTFIEVIVTVAILAIVGAFMSSAYANVLEDRRKESDLSKLENIDTTIESIMIHKDVFNEAKKVLKKPDNSVVAGYDNKLTFTFPVTHDMSTGESTVELEDGTVNSDTEIVLEKMPILYERLTEHMGDVIELESGSYKRGKYIVYVEFNGTQVSPIRDISITNDNLIITNSGDSYLKQEE